MVGTLVDGNVGKYVVYCITDGFWVIKVGSGVCNNDGVEVLIIDGVKVCTDGNGVCDDGVEVWAVDGDTVRAIDGGDVCANDGVDVRAIDGNGVICEGIKVATMDGAAVVGGAVGTWVGGGSKSLMALSTFMQRLNNIVLSTL